MLWPRAGELMAGKCTISRSKQRQISSDSTSSRYTDKSVCQRVAVYKISETEICFASVDVAPLKQQLQLVSQPDYIYDNR